MKTVLHFSEGTLPDMRIEKLAYQQKISGKYRTVFVGGKPSKPLNIGLGYSDIFDELINLESSRLTRLGIPIYYQKYKKKFENIYNIVNPDVVHAHNIFAAKVCQELGIQYIYDDHEFWSFQALARKVRPKSTFDHNRLTDLLFQRNIKKWEPKVIEHATSIIGVCPNHLISVQKKYDLGNDKRMHVISNFPMKKEVEIIEKLDLNKSSDDMEIIMVTKPGGYYYDQSVNKFMRGLERYNIPLTLLGRHNIENLPPSVNYKGFVPHSEFLKILSKSHIGLTIFAKDELPEYYSFMSPNRIFFYAHTGAIPLLKDEMTYLKNLFGNHAIFVSDEESGTKYLSEIYQNLDDILERSKKLVEFARKELIFENEYSVIDKIYNKS